MSAYVGTVRFFDHHRWLVRRPPTRRVALRELRVARVWIRVIRRELAETRAQLQPPLPTDPRGVRAIVERDHPCLASIIAGENRGYDVTLDFGGGHGNVGEAYGIPQANPGTKMASAGPDWRTNPWTQIRWMIGYVVQRFGGECAALEHKRSYGWY